MKDKIKQILNRNEQNKYVMSCYLTKDDLYKQMREDIRVLCDYLEKTKDFEVYICTDCKTINMKKNNGEIRVGFCDNCDHPLWNKPRV
jgi:hypothetical protein